MPDELSHGSSEIAALAQRVETARGKLPLQHDPALLQVLSEREIAAERELAEWIRAQRRKQQRSAIEAELAAEKRDRKSAAAIRRSDDADARWHRRALAARRRVSSADARLAQLYRRAEWSSRALIAVVVLGMVWAGVNVQHNLVPSGDMSDPLYWLSYGIEAMISIPIITIMVAATTAARWGRELARGKVIFFETALLGTTIALNAGPHLAAGDLGRAAEYAIAPVMVGVVIWLHAWVSARYAVLIDGAPVVERDPQTIRIEAELAPETTFDSGRYRPLDGRDGSANAGRFRCDGNADAAHLSRGLAADHVASGAPVHRPDTRDVQHSVNDDTVVHPGVTPTITAAFTRTDAWRESAVTSIATNRPAAAPADDAKPSSSNAVDLPTNGQAKSLSINVHAANDHAVNGHAVNDDHAVNGPRFTPTNHTNREIPETSITSGRAAESSSDGHAVAPHTDSPIFPQAINGHTVASSANGYFHDLPIDRHTAARTTNGHTAPPAKNGSAAPAVVSGEKATAPADDHPVSSLAKYVFGLPPEEHTTPSADDPTAHSSSTDVQGEPFSPAGWSSSADPDHAPVDAMGNDDKSGASANKPTGLTANMPASQQISIDEVHEFTVRERPAAADGNTNQASNGLPPQQLPSPEHGSRPTDRAHRGADAVQHESRNTLEPIHTLPVVPAGTVSQQNTSATAPRSARGKSLSTEQGDRSADAESEQLVLEEAPEPAHPNLRSEPMPILEPDEDQDLPIESDEADTDDDEISAIARAITGRHLSNLPLEEVREILALADQGGTTPAIANELGVSRSAVTRVLDSAIKVHRPYAITG
ncbi:hypothetical protein OHB12_28910 [Nocardia sp. NBC_01730]|uniref:hypothetical protein n=1 Tax=Nocardia sp. NBC_01730 TaxID=2975998 RepID=UPI002E144DCB|nr:hypothetical protein OHB12_28910 [Nocardia sp. NBC_01730]